MKIHPIILSLLFLPFLITCSQNDTVGPKPLENIGEQVFGSIDMQDQTHINVKNDSGGVYIYGYWNQDIIETMLYRTVSAESRTAAQERLLDVQLQHSRSEETIDIFATINTHPGRLRYSSWYNLELDNKLVLNIQDIPDDITVFSES